MTPGWPLLSRRFVVLFVAHFLGAASIHGANLLPLFITSLGGSALAIGVFVAGAAVSGILSRPFIGRLIDRRGLRTAFALSGALNLVAFLGYFAVDSLGVGFLLVRLLHGIGVGGLFTTFFAAAADMMPRARRAQGLGLFGISGMAGAGFGPWIGEHALARGGFDALFAVLLALGAASWLCSLLLGEPSRARARSPRILARSLIDAPLARTLALSVAFGFVVAALMTFVPPYAERTGLARISTFFVTYSATSILLRLVLSPLPDHLGHVRVLVPAIAVLGGATAWLAFDATPRGLVVAGVLGGTGHAFAFPTLAALLLERTDPERRGAALGTFTAAIDVGFLVAGPTLGLVALQGGYAAAFLLAGGISAGSALVFALAEQRASRLPEHAARASASEV